ncbi:acyl-CoA dehydrogenase family protein [Rhodococcus sp. HNM0569]|uniref:acyl-CoA dehydrogenase family protein n=1 Tax=Rhodococcus sp. HNM0569 TaxID=2716340 RepID=UPI00146D4912|nr:acyl-CoA dehydrogenase family protein [Rhodococcus sp. HNM0569]NLU84224.1 acyl-CoA dehydrogenase [Rhodococcus sp. HNM0569]
MSARGGTRHREFADMLDGLFARGAADDSPRLDRTLWSTLDEVGATWLTADESVGGSGATWDEAAVLLGAAGAHAVSLPLAENDLLALPLLAAARLPVAPSDGIRTVAVAEETPGGFQARSVPWARDVDRIVVVFQHDSQWHVADLPRASVSVTDAENYAGEPRDHLHVDAAALESATRIDATLVGELRLKGALARAAAVAGALDRILELVVEHTTARTQFGRPLARFQAVQFLAADIATETALVQATVDAAVATALRDGFGTDTTTFAVAAAKSTAGHGASTVTRAAHQAFGAIGFTREHALHRYTTRALAWRSEYGSTREWDERLTRAALAAGGDGLWPLLTAS